MTQQRDEEAIQNRTGLHPVHIVATDLDDAWFQVIRHIMLLGYRYPVEQGSYEGVDRLELDFVTIQVTNPAGGPLLPMMPEGTNMPPVADLNYIEQEYLPRYLLSSIMAENEQYTYGERINTDVLDGLSGVTKSQLDWVIKILKETPGTNQSTIEIGLPTDVRLFGKDGKYDPPCMRLIDCRVRYGALHLIAYFRSWDAWGGFPCNMAGLELMKRYMADQIGVESGELIGVSKGLHIYGHVEDLAAVRTHVEKKAA